MSWATRSKQPPMSCVRQINLTVTVLIPPR